MSKILKSDITRNIKSGAKNRPISTGLDGVNLENRYVFV